jgi:hypothetical protein
MTYLDEAVDAAVSEYGIRPSEAIQRAIRKAIEAAEPFVRNEERAKLEAQLHAAADKLEATNLEGDGPTDLTAATVRAVKAQGIRDAVEGLASHPTPDGEDETDASAQFDRALPPTPASPVLGDEERERLKRMAAFWQQRAELGHHTIDRVDAAGNAALLRRLAQGEER